MDRTVNDARPAGRVPDSGGGLAARLRRWLARGVAAAIIAGATVTATGAAAQAVVRGEGASFTGAGGFTISNFVLPNGKRAYCAEIEMAEPTGSVSKVGTVTKLPGRSGRFAAWGSAAGMRQMNYLLDTHGETRSGWTAATLQLTIWRMRQNFGTGSPALNRTIAALEGSAKGRKLIAASDDMYAQAKRHGVAPVAPKKVTAKLGIEADPAGREGKLRVTYPRGTVSLTVTGGTFVRNGAASLSVPATASGARYVDVAPGATKVALAGKWKTTGARGWEPKLQLYNSRSASGAVGQRLIVATGASSAKSLTGSFAKVTRTVTRAPAPPTAASQAQPSVEVGQTFSDTLIVTAPAGRELEMWPGAVADFTAYLLPEAGAVKYDEEWRPIRPELPEAVADDAEAEGGEAGGDEAESGESESGGAADGAEPEPAPEPEPLRWTAEELAAMSAAERCTAQPVHRVGGIAVDGPGEYSSGEVTARSGGVVHWVERVVSDGETVHVGVCGLANETTRIGQPGVVTRALPEAMIGDELHDVATVSGTLAAGAEYAVRFEAYRASVPANRAREEGCTAADRIFASDPVPVRGPGDVRSPGFTAEWAHGETVWWVETLLIDQGDGFEALHRGECGLPEETTRIGRPEVSTLAQERVVAGDPMVDTARVTGGIAANDGASWELVFTGYLAPEEDDAFDAGDAAGEETEGAADAEGAESPAADAESAPDAAPVCDDANRIFTTDPVPVEGPGEIDSPPVVADADWAGRVWWVETLWLVQGEERTAVHEGACGIPDETTLVTTPRITTEATEFAAVGDEIRDTARLTGELSAREGTAYDVVFAGYRGDPALTGTEEAECADDERLFETAPVPVDGPGDIVSPPVTALPEYGGTIWWVETLRITDADGTRDVVRGTCGLPGETTTVQFPTVRTESAGTIEVGEQMYDTAVVEGPITERPDAEVRVVFTAHARGADGALVCDAGTELPRLSDPEGAEVTGPGRYESRRVTTVPRDAGLGGYVETLLLIVDGERHVIHRGACGAAGEDFEIRAAAPPAAPGTPLATTGAADPGPLLPIAAALLLAGAAIAAVAGVRRARSRGTVRDCGDMREEAGARR